MSPPVKGTFHSYVGNLTAFQFGEGSPKHAVIFIGGLGDGHLTVPYVQPLAQALFDATEGEWTVVQGIISSSYTGWGLGLLARDAKELGLLAKYLRQECGFEKLVLAGHLTGCQDTIEYLTKTDGLPELQGAIIQAPVSDQEAFTLSRTKEEASAIIKEIEEEYISKGRSKDLLPQKYREMAFNVPISAYRFVSLYGTRGDDDFFSTYLTQEDHKITFGKVNTPLLVLYCENDEFAPKTVDKQALIDTWKASTDSKYWSSLSRVVKGATHNVGDKSEPGAEKEVVSTIIEFIKTLT